MPGASEDQPVLTIQQLSILVTTLQSEVVALKGENESLRETLQNVAHENELYKRRIYGNKTERTHTSEMQLTLGDLLADERRLQKQLDDAVAAANDDAGDGGESPKSKKRPKGRRDLNLGGLPRVPLEIVDPTLEKTAKRIGFEESLQLIHRRGGFAVLVKRTAKYEVTGKDGSRVLGVKTPKTLFPRGMLHSSVVAHIIVQKFGLGVPHHRFEQHLKSQLCEIDRSTMCRYTEEAGNALGATVVAAMWKDAINNAGVISTDATSAMIQPAKDESGKRQACKKGHFFTAVVDCDSVLFAYTDKHTQEFVKSLFAGFDGYLQADASNVYDILDRGPPEDSDDGVTLVGCWAHCRRYFFEAAICRYPVGVQGLMHIRALYGADNALKKLPPSKRKTMRNKHVRPLMDSFFEWVRSANASTAGRNLATKALGYATNQEDELRRVLDDPRLPLDNTRSERPLRKIVVSRKAWMFYGSDVHAQAAAALFSLIASCRLRRLDPEQYLDEVMRLLPYWPRERFLELAPTHWLTTRAKLDPDELARPLGAFTIPTQRHRSYGPQVTQMGSVQRLRCSRCGA